MTESPPLARISAAIEKLERLKAESTPTRWVFSEGSIIPRGMGYSVADYVDRPDAYLIVTLHRTIDAQIELLCAASNAAIHPEDVDREVVALADSIIGGES